MHSPDQTKGGGIGSGGFVYRTEINKAGTKKQMIKMKASVREETNKKSGKLKKDSQRKRKELEFWGGVLFYRELAVRFIYWGSGGGKREQKGRVSYCSALWRPGSCWPRREETG